MWVTKPKSLFWDLLPQQSLRTSHLLHLVHIREIDEGVAATAARTNEVVQANDGSTMTTCTGRGRVAEIYYFHQPATRTSDEGDWDHPQKL